MKKAVFLFLAVVSSGLGARAQDAPRGDLSVGYSYLREGFSGGANTHGASVAGAAYLNDWFGVVGDFGVYHLSHSGTSANPFTFLGGPRLPAHRRKGASPSVHAALRADGRSVSGFCS